MSNNVNSSLLYFFVLSAHVTGLLEACQFGILHRFKSGMHWLKGSLSRQCATEIQA